MKSLKIILLPILFLLCLTGCSCKKDDFVECSSSLLNISGGNYTIEINDNGKYDGKYYITSDIIKKETQTSVYFYFVEDNFNIRYYYTVDGYKTSNDNGELLSNLSTIKKFFTDSNKLLTNEDNSIFKTKTGNKIYNINSTELNLVSLPSFITGEIKDLKNSITYTFCNSAVKISSANLLEMYIKKTSGLNKYEFKNSMWTKIENDKDSLEDIKTELLQNLTTGILNNSIYLTKEGFSVKISEPTIVQPMPQLTNRSYTLKDLDSGTIYYVTQNLISIRDNTGLNISAYEKKDNKFYEYYLDKTNTYLLKKELESSFDWDSIMQNKIDGFCYANNTLTSYLLVGTTDYNLYSLDTTKVIAEEDGEIVLNIETLLQGHKFTLKDIENEIAYTFSGDILEIDNIKEDRIEYVVNEDDKIYIYKKEGDTWYKYLTQTDTLFDFVGFYSQVSGKQIIKLTDNDLDFVIEDLYEIYNYDEEIELNTPNDYIER